ncbi:phosphatidylinositol N-acetylglucosaminyltransferase [Purpureocillium lavendulum]|uniref:Phosphatidylinositol N-acetylglucosaminyltransferase n=1 Tax=Purpureocillium lavendulum TaxID=1247861 RepID=A0AB34FXS1_9HYPO|nr:phosphatidylinositol N-acetylglucosaminyltransferase [Purpureocillium lavendulum]
MPSPTDDETPFPPLTHASTFSVFGRSHLSPHDAAPPQQHRRRGTPGAATSGAASPLTGDYVDGAADSLPRMRHMASDRSTSRRRKRAWKKLMWVKQSCTWSLSPLPPSSPPLSTPASHRVLTFMLADPDNYTDQATFLENLQRNPRLKPYDFWPLVADSTVILQHVCSVIIFVVCFVGIYKERVSPVSVASWSSFGTFLGWSLWERWVSEEEDQDDELLQAGGGTGAGTTTTLGRAGSVRRRGRAASMRRPPPHPLRTESFPSTSAASLTPSATPSAIPSAASSTSNLHLNGTLKPPQSASTTSLGSQQLGPGPRLTPRSSQEMLPLPPAPANMSGMPTEPEESRAHQRLGTIKSALLIYCTLLGLSPILKSLTRSTSSDSIWAMSFWLLAINIFFFDYSGGVGAKFPASLSTNAALMASTVLASRLPSTKQVFSLTLFSIQVFGLFPVFRRHVRHRSWRYHVVQTALLVVGAGVGVGMVVSDPRRGAGAAGWPWKNGTVGMVVGVVVAALATGGCSWWLIGLQKYKNEIRGPWDPARPIIMSRTRWDDR